MPCTPRSKAQVTKKNRQYRQSFPGPTRCQEVADATATAVPSFRGSYTLKHSGQTVLQRFSHASADKVTQHNRRAAAGHLLKERLFDESLGRDPRGRTRHLGIWQTRWGDLGYTRQHRNHPELCGQFLAWLADYFKHHIYTRRGELESDFLDLLEARAGVLPYLEHKLGAGQTAALHSWYQWVAVFQGCGNPAAQPHKDGFDAMPSILVNMQGEANLLLGDYDIRIGLKPGDMMVFTSRTVSHKSESVGQKSEGRWSVGMFSRQGTVHQRGSKAVKSLEVALQYVPIVAGGRWGAARGPR